MNKAQISLILPCVVLTLEALLRRLTVVAASSSDSDSDDNDETHSDGDDNEGTDTESETGEPRKEDTDTETETETKLTMSNTVVVTKIEVPAFTGEGNVSIQEFCDRMDSAMRGNKWDDTTAAEQAKSRIQGRAYDWLYNQQTNQTTGINAWKAGNSNLRSLLIERFDKEASCSERVLLRLNLRQEEEESPDFFMDRCHKVMYKIEKVEISEAIRTGADTKGTYEKIHTCNVLSAFIAGLKPHLKEKVIEHKATDDWRKALQAARAADESKKKANANKVMAVQEESKTEDKTLQALVAAIEDLRKRQDDMMKGRGSQQQQQHQGGTSTRRLTGNCFYCGKPGHPIRECKGRMKDEKDGVPGRKACDEWKKRQATRAGQGQQRVAAAQEDSNNSPFRFLNM